MFDAYLLSATKNNSERCNPAGGQVRAKSFGGGLHRSDLGPVVYLLVAPNDSAPETLKSFKKTLNLYVPTFHLISFHGVEVLIASFNLKFKFIIY